MARRQLQRRAAKAKWRGGAVARVATHAALLVCRMTELAQALQLSSALVWALQGLRTCSQFFKQRAWLGG